MSAVLGGKAEELVDGEFDGVRIGGDSRRPRVMQLHRETINKLESKIE